MSCTVELMATDQDRLYPSPAEDEPQPVASAGNVLPILWIACFRPRDLRKVEPDDPGYRNLMEPFATTEKALQQLDAAKPTLADMFSDLGTLDGYCDWLGLAISAARKRFLCFQSLDLAHEEPEWFRAHLTYAMGVFEQRVPLAVGRKSLLSLSEWDPARHFPTPANLAWPSAGDAWIDQGKIIGAPVVDYPG